MTTLILTQDGLKIKPRTLVMNNAGRIEFAEALIDQPEIEWKPNLHPRWPKKTMQGAKNIGGEFMKAFDTDAILKELGPEPSSGPSKTKVNLTWWVQGSPHIKELELFRANGQTGQKVVARMRLETVVPKKPVVTPSQQVKIADLKVGDQFKDRLGKEWEVTQGAGESYVTVKPIGNNTYDHGETRLIGKADAFPETPIAPPTGIDESADTDDGSPSEVFSNYSAFVTDYDTFTLEKLATLLEGVNDTQPIEQQAHGYKISPVEGNYHQYVAANKGENVAASSSSLGNAAIFARPTTSNTPDSAPHDSSILKPQESGLTDAQWAEFGANDQKLYNDLMAKYGAWSSKKGSSLIQKAKGEADYETKELYDTAISNQKGSSKHATDAGFLFNKTEGYNVYGSKPGEVEATKTKYLKFEYLMKEIQDITSWDLFNRVKDSSIILFHHNDFSVEQMKENVKTQQLVVNQYPFFGGVSWTTNQSISSFGTGSSTIIARMPINRISLYNLIQPLYSSGEAEYTIRQEMFFDPNYTLFAHLGSQWEGGPDTYQKLKELSTTGNPKPGSLWPEIQGWYKGYVDPPKPLGDMQTGQFFRTPDDVIWNIDKIDAKGVHAHTYLNSDGTKAEKSTNKIWPKTEELPPVAPQLEAGQLDVGEVILDSDGNKWQNAGIFQDGKTVLIPYDVTDSQDPHAWTVSDSKVVKISSLKEEVPAWVDTFNGQPHTSIQSQLEGAIVLTPWGQRLEVLTPGKHGEPAKLIQVDDEDNQLPDTQQNMDPGVLVAQLKKGHEPLPPPSIGDKVALSQLSIGDVFSFGGVDIKIQNNEPGSEKFIYDQNVGNHMKGEVVTGSTFTPSTQVTYVTKGTPPLISKDNQYSAASVYIDDLKVGSTFWYKNKYWQLSNLDGGEAEVFQPNPGPGDSALPKSFPLYTKVAPSAVPSQPAQPYIADSTIVPFNDLKTGDKIMLAPKDGSGSATNYVVNDTGFLSNGTKYVKLGSGGGYTYSESDLNNHNIHLPSSAPRPKPGEAVIGKSLWLGDVVEDAMGNRITVVKSPTFFNSPFVKYGTNIESPEDASTYYTYLGTISTLTPGKAPTINAPLSPGDSYDTPLDQVKPGYLIQTTNGSHWRVENVGSGTISVQGVDASGDPVSTSANISTSDGDPVHVIDTGRRALSTLSTGDTFQFEGNPNQNYVVIGHNEDGTTKIHLHQQHGNPYISTKPQLADRNEEDVLYTGKSTPHPEMAPTETEATSGYAKKSGTIGEVELWQPGSVVVSGNYYYVVGGTAHGKTTLTDLAGIQHEVNSKKFYVKSSSNGPKPVKGLHIVPSNELLYKESPKKGQYFYWKNKMWVSLTPQIKSLKAVQVDEYGNTVGDVKKIEQLGKSYMSKGTTGLPIMQVLKDGATTDRPLSVEYKPTEIASDMNYQLQVGDYVQDQQTKAHLMVLSKENVGGVNEMHLATLDQYGNVTGNIAKQSNTDDFYNLVTSPVGTARASSLPEGTQVLTPVFSATPEGEKEHLSVGVVVLQAGNYAKVVNVATGQEQNVQTPVKIDIGPKYAPKAGEQVNSWFLNPGDTVLTSANNYYSSTAVPVQAIVTSKSGSILYLREEATGKDFKINNNWGSRVVEMVKVGDGTVPEPPSAIPVTGNKLTSFLVQVGSTSDKPLMKDLPVGTIFSYKTGPSQTRYWKIASIDPDGTVHGVADGKYGDVSGQISNRTWHTSPTVGEKTINSPVTVLEWPTGFSSSKATKIDDTTKVKLSFLKVGESFQLTALGAGIYQWKVADISDGGYNLDKMGSNPDQALHTYVSGTDAKKLDVTYIFSPSEPYKAPNLNVPNDFTGAAPDDWIPGNFYQIKIGDVIWSDSSSSNIKYGKNTKSLHNNIPQGNYFEVISGDYNTNPDYWNIKSILTGTTWIWNKNWTFKTPSDDTTPTLTASDSGTSDYEVQSDFTGDAPPDWLAAGDSSALQVGDQFWKPSSKSTGFQSGTGGGISSTQGNYFEVVAKNSNVLHIKSLKTGETYPWDGSWTGIKIPPPVIPETPIKARAFTEAVKTEQSTGTPRIAAIRKTARATGRTMDQAIDAFPDANEPPSGNLIPMNELAVGDTYKIVAASTSPYNGWQWKITAQNDDGGFQIEAVNKKPKQPKTMTTGSFSMHDVEVEKIASENPSATLNPLTLKVGDIFQVKVDTGQIYTWNVVSLESGNIGLKAVGSTKENGQKKNFATTLENITNNLESGAWLPV